MFFHWIITMEFTLFFFTVNSSVNAAWSSLNAVCQRKLHGKSIQLKTFPQGNVITPCGVVINKVFRLIVVAYGSIKPKLQAVQVLLSILSFFPFLLCFVCLFVLLLSINIYLNNCYLIKCINKQQEKYHVSREKIERFSYDLEKWFP